MYLKQEKSLFVSILAAVEISCSVELEHKKFYNLLAWTSKLTDKKYLQNN